MTGDGGDLRRRLMGGSVIDAFVAQVEAAPTAPAIRERTDTISYSEIAQAAFGIGNQVVDRLGGESEPVLLLMAQGVRAIASTLAVLSAGKYYVPFDQRSPIGLIHDVVARVQPTLILTEPEHLELARALGVASVLVVDQIDRALGSVPPVTDIDPNAKAYVYFTSGSTGAPKGVIDTHRNVLNNSFRYATTLGFDASDCMSLIQSPSSSGVVGTQFGALCSGGALCPVDIFGRDAPEEIAISLRKNAITVFHANPSLFQFFTELRLGETESLRLVRLEGDRATSADVGLLRQAYGSDVTLVNGLGATECGLIRQLFVRPGEQVSSGPLPVGYAVPDTEVEVLGPDGAKIATGEEGEVVVRSDYLAAGYWNDAVLTADRFRRDVDGGRVYHTGDVGRLGPDGLLELIGRTDDQVKVRGATLNLGAVEAIILAQPGVTGALVGVEDSPRPRRLVASVTCEPGAEPDNDRIRQAILERLPTAAIPTIRHVESLPTTSAGKLERSKGG